MKDYIANFKEYWPQQMLHLIIGIFAGMLLILGEPAAGAVLMAMVIARQALEYHKLHDTVHIDLAVYIFGLLLGIIMGLIHLATEVFNG